MSKKSHLGRGLSALMADIEVSLEKGAPEKAERKTAKKNKADTKKTNQTKSSIKKPSSVKSVGIDELPIEQIERNPDQPRRHFDKTALMELSDSIKQKGVLQPILVRPIPASQREKYPQARYQIVAGERRWQAAQMAGLENLPALVRTLSDVEVLEIGVIENVQRADLNPMEEAKAYRTLISEFGRKQAEIAEATGKSRSHIANVLRLLALPVLAQDYLQKGRISAGHARAILAAPDPQALAEIIVSKGLSVRAAESWARKLKKGTKPNIVPARDANIEFIEKKLSQQLGMKVKIDHKNPGGKLSVSYKNIDEFDVLVKQLGK